MSAPADVSGARSSLWQVWLVLGLGLLAVAWLLPVNVKSLNTALLREAGRETPTVAAFGRDLLALDKPGPAALVLDLRDHPAETLARARRSPPIPTITVRAPRSTAPRATRSAARPFPTPPRSIRVPAARCW